MLIKTSDGTWINPDTVTKIIVRDTQVSISGHRDLYQVYNTNTKEEAEELGDKLARQVNGEYETPENQKIACFKLLVDSIARGMEWPDEYCQETYEVILNYGQNWDDQELNSQWPNLDTKQHLVLRHLKYVYYMLGLAKNKPQP
jgi:hypothetical protein